MKDKLSNLLGLDQKTEKIYQALLYLADAPASRIAQETGLKRTSIYHSLEKLAELGLVSTYTDRGVKRFAAENPNKLKSFFERKMILAERLIPELQKEISKSFLNSEVKIFRGQEAIKSISEDALKTREKTVFSFGSSKKLLQFIEGKFGYGKRRRAAGILIRAIRQAGDELPSDSKLSQIKFIPKEIDFPGHILVYDQKVCIILFENNGVGIIIESSSFSKMLKSIFNLLWQRL